MSAPVAERVPGYPWAYGLMAGFTVGLFLVTGSVFWDHEHRFGVEVVTQPTAVGDPPVVQYDPRQSPAKEICRWQGVPYYLETNEVFDLPDGEVLKLALDDSQQIQLYRAPLPADPRRVLVKVAHNAFLRLTTR
ncbi:MAG TPA: hypothetical protein VGD78_06525 [Chthoniobacterales bacterium]